MVKRSEASLYGLGAEQESLILDGENLQVLFIGGPRERLRRRQREIRSGTLKDQAAAEAVAALELRSGTARAAGFPAAGGTRHRRNQRSETSKRKKAE